MEPGYQPAYRPPSWAPPPERPRRRGRGALYAALAAAVVALAVLAWSVTGATGTEPQRPDADAAGAPDRLPGRPSGEEALLDNPLYESGRLSPLPCPVPELDVADPASVEGFLDTVADCLDYAWETQFAKAGLPYRPPDRVFWEEAGSSPCREYPSAAGAFYCRTSLGIYIGTSDVVEKWKNEPNGVVYASLLAHEYAHHVQGEAGLLEYYHEQRGQESGEAAKNTWTRRSELQANCFAGVFLGSVQVTYPLDDGDVALMLDDAEATADRADGPPSDRTHGSAENSRTWIEHGFQQQSPGACNTWTASSGLVS
ncbi:neutral zinc metallopeptidase [Nocardiopsis coralliicola]